MQAILKELEMQTQYIAGQNISSIYFGGGTPSLIKPVYIDQILNTIHQNYSIESDAEITIEVNPDDLHREKLMAISYAGINRLSIGIQSFQDAVLQWMNRAHSAADAFRSIELAFACNFKNISADLIYGVPDQQDDAWHSNLQILIDAGVPHISAYALTVEPKTFLYSAIKKNLIKKPDDIQAERQFKMMQNILQQSGYVHYEISNFAKPGMFSRHNSGYWKGTHYLGIGPSAHSFDGVSRQWNVSNNSQYIQQINENKIPAEREELTKVQRANEMIMTSLRTHSGLDMEIFKNQFGEEFLFQLNKNIIDVNIIYLEKENSALKITDAGKFLSDGIISNLFLE